MKVRAKHGFTIVELLIVVSIIALLIGILLPAIGHARETALMNQSKSNLRQIGAAHQVYASEWNDNQWTVLPHNFARFGNGFSDASSNYCSEIGAAVGKCPPSGPCAGLVRMDVGHGYWPDSGNWEYIFFCGVPYQVLPISLTSGVGMGHGAFRMYSVKSFNQYVSGRYYDRVFFAPKDRMAIDAVGDCWDYATEFCLVDSPSGIIHTSYALSPAAMYAPEIWSRPHGNFPGSNDGFFTTQQGGGPAAFRTPTMSQARHASLKSHMVEYHWLQNGPRQDCNPNPPQSVMGYSDYHGCVPYYFNHSRESNPVVLFYDGSVDNLSVTNAVESDIRAAGGSDQNLLNEKGLWRRDVPNFGMQGFFGQNAESNTPATGFHMFTRDGIRGRDRLSR